MITDKEQFIHLLTVKGVPTFDTGCVLNIVDDNLKNDKEVVMMSVKFSGNNLEFASDNLKNDKAVVMSAVKSCGFALRWASDELKMIERL